MACIEGMVAAIALALAAAISKLDGRAYVSLLARRLRVLLLGQPAASGTTYPAALC